MLLHRQTIFNFGYYQIMEQSLSQARILVVDDDDFLRSVLLDQLRREGVLYLEEANGAGKVAELVEQFEPDLILLDVQMPDGNGFDVCSQLRMNGFDRPIIMLTGQTEEGDVIEGLDAGANDYIGKPMRIGELMARIRTQLRQFKASDAMRFTLGDLDFVPANKSVTYRLNGTRVGLTEKETLILKTLVRARPDGVSKEQLLTEVWGFQPDLTTHTLETHIYRLRQKLRRVEADKLVETTKTGYQLSQ